MTTVPSTLAFLDGQPKFMREHGFNVTFISSPGPDLERFAAEQGASAEGVQMSREISPFADMASLLRLILLLLRIRPVILHLHTPKAGLLGAIAGWCTNVPVRVYHLHGLPAETSAGLRRLLLVGADKLVCRLVHQVFCVSQSLRDSAVNHGVARASRATVLLGGSINGIDSAVRYNPKTWCAGKKVLRDALRIPPDSLVVGFVGRIVPAKGILELSAAWLLLSRECPTVYLVLIGAEEAHDPIPPDILCELREHPRVRWVGQVEDAAPYYSIFHVLVLPSHREGFGMAALEAASMKVPVVATRVTGLVDAVVDEQTGTLVPPYDATRLAASLHRYLIDEGRWSRHGQAGRRRAILQFDPEAIWKELLENYQELIANQTQ